MLAYGYDADTGEFTGEIMTQRDPLSGRALVPWNATLLQPPGAGQRQKAVFAGGAWSLTADYRGETWFAGREPVQVEALGEPVGLTREPAPLTADEQWIAIRAQRDALLRASDWTQVADTPLSGLAAEAWRAYRRSLRDLPEAFDDPSNVIWPETP